MSAGTMETMLWGPKQWKLKESMGFGKRMDRPRLAMPRVAAPATTEAQAEAAGTEAERQRRRRGATMATLLTGGLGLEEQAPVRRKRLLGE